MWTDRLGDPALALGPVPSWWPAGRAIAVAARDGERFVTVVLADPADPAFLGDAGHRRVVLHAAMAHLTPGGTLVVVGAPAGVVEQGLPGAVEAIETVVIDAPTRCEVFRRTGRYTVHDLVADARVGLHRLTPSDLAAALAGQDPPLVIDTRTPTDRQRWGTIAGAQHVPRTVLEWRLDPANGYLHPAIHSFDQPVVVVCNHGYSSSLAAAALASLGYTHVFDLVGGMAAWRADGRPVVPPDHSFLEL